MNGVNKSKKEPLGKVGVGNGLVLVKVIGKETVSKMQSSVMVLDVQLLANPSSVTNSALKPLANFLFSKTISKGVRIILFLVIFFFLITVTKVFLMFHFIYVANPFNFVDVYITYQSKIIISCT
jgi:hypothetical protein